MSATYTFRDAQLTSPALRFLNAAGAGLERLALERPRLSTRDILQTAQAKTGLQNIDDDGVLEALSRFVDAARSDANLNTLGRLAVKNMLVDSLSARLRVLDWHDKNPQLQRENIDRPWIVIGLPRTGTSILSILLGLDPLSRPLLQWEARQPIPPPTLATAAEDPRIGQLARQIAKLHAINPALATMHPFGSTLAEECTALFTYALRTIGMETIAFVPSYGHWLDDADMTSAYTIHKRTLQALQHAQPTAHWVLKSPNHLLSLPELLQAYPDARIIWTHRDPARLVPSLASLNCALQIQFTHALDPHRVGEYWAQRVQRSIDKATAFSASAGDGWCYHLQYADLVAEPEQTLEKVYAHFGEPLSLLHRRRIQTWLHQRPQSVDGIHAYNAADFGWTNETLAQRYDAYRSRYAVPLETEKRTA